VLNSFTTATVWGDPIVPAASRAIELGGRSAAIQQAQELVLRASVLDTGVLLVAEPGVDAGSVARELHARSGPSTRPFIAVECGAARLDRAMFGDAPTHALRDLEYVASASLLASARGGTLYLAEVCDLPASVQMRLARIARDGEIRLDGQAVITNVRLVASAALGIDGDVRDERFRPDLYRRLAATRIDLPPLRDRSDDVAALAERLLTDLCATAGMPAKSFAQAALALLSALSWPGNLAELRALVGCLAAGPDAVIQIEHVVPALPFGQSTKPLIPVGSLRDARRRFEREYISAVLRHHGWRIADAARTLGIQRPNLYRKARQLGIPVARLSE
jgi:DNA-binding NtrC family response regulator